MMTRGFVIVLVVVFATACGGGQRAAAPTPAPQVEPAQPSPAVVAPSPAPAAGGPVTTLPLYPGAKQTGSSSFTGMGPTGGEGQWVVVILETRDRLEQVRDFYKANPPRGYTQSFSTEQSQGQERTFAMWFARADDKAWHTVTATEYKDEGRVEISLSSGLSP